MSNKIKSTYFHSKEFDEQLNEFIKINNIKGKKTGLITLALDYYMKNYDNIIITQDQEKIDYKNIDKLPPKIIDDLKRKVRAYGRFDTFTDIEGMNLDGIVAMIEYMEKLEAEEQQIYVRKLLEKIHNEKTLKKINDLEDKGFNDIINHLKEYSGFINDKDKKDSNSVKKGED